MQYIMASSSWIAIVTRKIRYQPVVDSQKVELLQWVTWDDIISSTTLTYLELSFR